jgi:hypothetical protein
MGTESVFLQWGLIHTYHAVPLPCRVAKGKILCLSHLIYTVPPCLIHTCNAAPMSCPCHATTMPFCKRLLKVTAQRGLGAACVEWYRPSRDGMWAACPGSGSSGYHAELHEDCYRKHTNPLNCRTSSLDISGDHADFHEGNGAVGKW